MENLNSKKNISKALDLLIKSLKMITVLAVLIFITSCNNQKTETLDLLCWTRYNESELLKPFEDKYNVKVNAKTYIGGDQMYALFNAAQEGTFDLIVIDVEYGDKLQRAGKLLELDKKDYNFSNYLELFKDFPPSYKDGKMYSVIVGWGSIGLVYNTNIFTENEVNSYNVLWSDKAKSKTDWWDWYLPNMGVLGKYLEYPNPYDINSEQFKYLSDTLFSLRPYSKAIHSNVSDIISDFSNQEAYIAPGIGEWVAAILIQNNQPINWIVPEEGGVLWVEGLAIPKGSKNVDLAKKFINYLQEPEIQASLAWRKGYCSNVPNILAYDYMTDEKKNILRIHNKQEADELLDRLTIRTLPLNQSEEEWQNQWQKFKINN